MADVVVVGAGVIGLAAAWHLAGDGIDVTVLDAGSLGGQSSQAAAGILGPLAESRDDGPRTRLLWDSWLKFPAWVEALREDSAIDPEFEPTGILRQVAAAEREDLEASLPWRRQYSPEVEWLDDTDPDWPCAIWSPHEGQIRGPAYLAALAQAAAERGVDLRLGEPARRIRVDHDRVVAVDTPRQSLATSTVVLAAGAWAAALLPHPEPLPVLPVRGQALAIRAPRPPFPHVVFGPRGYLAPKRDGQVVVGATEDAEAGFDARVTFAGIATLADVLRSMSPELLPLPFDRVWAGLRPATPDGRPLLGPWPGIGGLIIAAGHYRNGLLLSPITAEIVRQVARGETPPVDLTPFRPDRFHPTR